MDPPNNRCEWKSEQKPHLLGKPEFCRWLDEGHPDCDEAIKFIKEFREETGIQELKNLFFAHMTLAYNYWEKAANEKQWDRFKAISYKNHEFCVEQIGRIGNILQLNDYSEKKLEYTLCWTAIAMLHFYICATSNSVGFHQNEASEAFQAASEKAKDLDDDPVRFIFDMCFAKFKFELLEEKEEARKMLKSDLDKIKENRLEFAPEDERISDELKALLGDVGG